MSLHYNGNGTGQWHHQSGELQEKMTMAQEKARIKTEGWQNNGHLNQPAHKTGQPNRTQTMRFGGVLFTGINPARGGVVCVGPADNTSESNNMQWATRRVNQIVVSISRKVLPWCCNIQWRAVDNFSWIFFSTGWPPDPRQVDSNDHRRNCGVDKNNFVGRYFLRTFAALFGG